MLNSLATNMLSNPRLSKSIGYAKLKILPLSFWCFIQGNAVSNNHLPNKTISLLSYRSVGHYELRYAPHALKYVGIEKDLRNSGLEDDTVNRANVDDFKCLRVAWSTNRCFGSR
jgi:hypothetical protein